MEDEGEFFSYGFARMGTDILGGSSSLFRVKKKRKRAADGRGWTRMEDEGEFFSHGFARMGTDILG
jgi:hypothetical protein